MRSSIRFGWESFYIATRHIVIKLYRHWLAQTCYQGWLQMRCIFKILAILIAIASLGLAAEKDISSSTSDKLQFLIDGEIEVPVVSTPSAAGESLAVSTAPKDSSSKEQTQAAMETIIRDIAYSDKINNDKIGSIVEHRSRDINNLDLLSQYYIKEKNEQKANEDLAGKISANMAYVYKRSTEIDTPFVGPYELRHETSLNHDSFLASDAAMDTIRIADEDFILVNNNSNYYYEKERTVSGRNDYLKNHLDATKEDTLKEINAGSVKDLSVSHLQYKLSESQQNIVSDLDNLKYAHGSFKTEADHMETTVTYLPKIKTETNNNLNRLIQQSTFNAISTYLIPADQMHPIQIPNYLYMNNGAVSQSRKNYAVVVGVNNYTDRSSLHTSVNDAETIAALLEAYGYNVTKLTDLTDEKPTKSNILEKAIGEMKNRKDVGKVLIYFSGHGEKNGNNYYLIPQDGNGQLSSYISAQELQKSIQGMKSVALVVDACNAGGLENIAGNDQIILASSKEDQPSNEMWFGSLSLFTYNLCNTIRDEEKTSGTVILERCFYKAREATKSWSRWHLVGQDPQIIDKTEGYFSLN